ncbi:MAG: hypothetical protein C0392_02780 [Syntrophus sp. (in: bacteria)]|nr:hypothetical protein [Syntrophus sp. (in: bacteria)]
MDDGGVLVAVFIAANCGWCANAADSAREAIKLGMHERALKILNARLDEKPSDVDAHLALAECYFAMRDFSAADTSLDRVLVLKPGYTYQVGSAYHSAGERAMRNNRLAEAKMLYDKAIANAPAFKKQVAGKYMIIGNGLLAQGQINEALMAYYQEVSINPKANRNEIAERLFNRGKNYLGSNDAMAENLFSRASSIDSSYAGKVSQAKNDYAQSLLARAKASTKESEKEELKKLAVKYGVSLEKANKEVPSRQ